MKNLVISILAAWAITGMEFWEFTKSTDRPIITLAFALLIFVFMVAFEEWSRERRIKRFWAGRFWRNVSEMQNRP